LIVITIRQAGNDTQLVISPCRGISPITSAARLYRSFHNLLMWRPQLTCLYRLGPTHYAPVVEGEHWDKVDDDHTLCLNSFISHKVNHVLDCDRVTCLHTELSLQTHLKSNWPHALPETIYLVPQQRSWAAGTKVNEPNANEMTVTPVSARYR